MRAPIRIDRPPILNRARPTTTPGTDDRSWYHIVNRASGDDDTAEVWIYDEIGWDVAAGPFARELAQLDVKNIHVRMNTPGGSVFDGVAIYNALLQHPARVVVRVDGAAISAGSIIAQAGDEVIMGRNTQMMIHDAAGFCMGNTADMEKMRDLLDRLSDEIASVYADRAGGSVKEWRERMLAETWYSADEAVKAGLADAMAPAPKRRGEDDEDSDGDDMPMDPDEMDPDEDDDDEKVAALLKQHDLAGRYRYPGRDAAPEPVPVPAEPAEPAAMIPGEQVTTTASTASTITVTYTGSPADVAAAVIQVTGHATGAAPADEDDDEPGADEAPETPAPGSPAPTPEPAPEPDDTDTTEDTGDEGQDDEPAPDAEPTARGWADLTGHLTTPDTWAALTGKLTQHHRTTEPSITDLLARLRHKEPTA